MNILDDQIEELMYKFDFEKVSRVMQFMNWRWASSGKYDAPTVDELKRCARSLLTEVAANYYETRELFSYVKTGGFAARLYVWEEIPKLELNFEIESKFIV